MRARYSSRRLIVVHRQQFYVHKVARVHLVPGVYMCPLQLLLGVQQPAGQRPPALHLYDGRFGKCSTVCSVKYPRHSRQSEREATA